MRDVLAFQGARCPHVPDLVPVHVAAVSIRVAPGPRRLDVVTLFELVAEASDAGIDQAELVRRIESDLATGALVAGRATA